MTVFIVQANRTVTVTESALIEVEAVDYAAAIAHAEYSFLRRGAEFFQWEQQPVYDDVTRPFFEVVE